MCWSERIHSAIGALVGILFTGMMMRAVSGTSTPIPPLVVPMGAFIVLLSVVPASPFAQPWSIIGDDLVVATVGVTFALLVNDPVIASTLAISAVIVSMPALRRVYPPSGTAAFTVVIGGLAVYALSYRFVLKPVLIQSTLLLVGVLVYHAVTGHRYPHTQRLFVVKRPPTAAGFTCTSTVATLRRQSKLLDIDLEDIEAVLRETQLQAYTCTFQALACADIMIMLVIMVLAGTSIPRVLELSRQYGFRASPAVGEGRRVVGIVMRVDLLGLAPVDMCQMLYHWSSIGVLTPPCIVDHTKTHARIIVANMPMLDLALMFASIGHHRTPVLDTDDWSAGIVTGSDLVDGLYHQVNIKSQAV